MRSVTAAAAASGSRLSVTGSMSANTGRARSNTQAFALATNENGDVTTSSPSLTPTARSARCRPAVPLDTALACAAPSRARERLLEGRHARAERELAASAGPRRPRAPPPRRGPGGRAGSAPCPPSVAAAPALTPSGARLVGRRAARPAPRLLGVLQRVHERLPRRGDDVLVDADRAPHVLAVGGVDEHARDRAGAVALVEDADLVVDELDVAQVRVDLGDRVAQRGVERVDRPVALGGADVALAVDPDLDRRLGLDLAVGALLDDHPPRLEREQRLVLAALAPHQQLERAVGRLEVVAARARAPSRDRRSRVAVASSTVRPAAAAFSAAVPRPDELGDEQLAAVADEVGIDVLEGRRVGPHARDVHPALVGEGVLARRTAGSGRARGSAARRRSARPR